MSDNLNKKLVAKKIYDKVKEQTKVEILKKVKMNFDELFKVRIIKNTKKPAEKGFFNKRIKSVSDHFNVAIITGELNNLLVIDIDAKDGGLEEWDKYIKKFGDIITVKQKTINGGWHYYFLFSHSDPSCAFLISTLLLNRSKYRNCGIDIRSVGGYIMCAPSVIDGKKYQFINSFKTTKVSEIPKSLILFLLEGSFGMNKKVLTTKKKGEIIKNNIVKSDYVMVVNEDELEEVFKKLPQKYWDNFDDWLKVLTVSKNLNMWDLFDKYSKKGKGYDKEKNRIAWYKNSGIFDLNYLIYELTVLGIHDLRFFESYKKNLKLELHKSLNSIIMNNAFLHDDNYEGKQFDYKIFTKYDTFVIGSSPGSGKTFAFVKHAKKYFGKNKNLRFISIVDRISMDVQHCASCKDAELKVCSYRKGPNIEEDNIIVCINSLIILKDLSVEDMKNIVLYIDEVSSFIESLVMNCTLDKNLRLIFDILMDLIINCHKVVVSDATINDAIFIFLSCRPDNKKIYIKNEFVKYEGLVAKRIYDERVFLKEMVIRCEEGTHFFFGSDSATFVRKYYHECIKHVPEERKGDYILMTAEDKFELINPSVQLKNKTFFYSPSIQYGIDASWDIPQDVFIYMSGNSITPMGSWQQTCRCRNIKKLYFHSAAVCRPAKYNSLEDTKNQLIENIRICDKINTDVSLKKIETMCVSTNDLGKSIVNNNLFFKLCYYVEYQCDIYKTNPTEKFIEILKNNGIEVIDKKKKLIKLGQEINKKLENTVKDINEKLFKQYLKEDDRDEDKYDTLNNRVKLLSLKTDIQLNTYKQYIMKQIKFDKHNNFVKMLKTKKYIVINFNKFDKNSENSKILRSIYQKINILFWLEENIGMNRFQFDFIPDGYDINEEDNSKNEENSSDDDDDDEEEDDDIEVEDDIVEEEDDNMEKKNMYELPKSRYNLIKKIFRTIKKNPATWKEYIELYISMIKNIAGCDIIKKKRIFKNKKRRTVYVFNIENICEHINLDKIKNKLSVNYNKKLLERIYSQKLKYDEQIEKKEKKNLIKQNKRIKKRLIQK
jgi:hypothetical protein